MENSTTQDTFIFGIGLKNYRSFGPNMQFIWPFSKINIFIGKNNSGKSNILSFINNIYPEMIKNDAIVADYFKLSEPLSSLDMHNLGKESDELEFAVLVPEEVILSNLYKKLQERNIQLHDIEKGFISKILNSNVLRKGTNQVCCCFTSKDRISFAFNYNAVNKNLFDDANLSHELWSRLWRSLTPNSSGGSILNHWIPESIRIIIPLSLKRINKEHYLISAIRQVQNDSTENQDSKVTVRNYDGRNLICILKELA